LIEKWEIISIFICKNFVGTKVKRAMFCACPAYAVQIFLVAYFKQKVTKQ